MRVLLFIFLANSALAQLTFSPCLTGSGGGLTNLNYNNITNAPMLGTAAYSNASAFALIGQLTDATNHSVPASLFPSLTGDLTTSGGSLTTTLKNTGTAGSYTKITFDAQGRETSGTTLGASDIPTLTVAKLSDAGASAYSNASAFVLSGATLSDASVPLVALTNADTRALTFGKSISATNGLASFSTVSAATIAATGWTNIWSTNNATVYVSTVAVAFTVKNRANSTLYTSPTLTTTMSVPGWAITAASGLSGTALPW